MSNDETKRESVWRQEFRRYSGVVTAHEQDARIAVSNRNAAGLLEQLESEGLLPDHDVAMPGERPWPTTEGVAPFTVLSRLLHGLAYAYTSTRGPTNEALLEEIEAWRAKVEALEKSHADLKLDRDQLLVEYRKETDRRRTSESTEHRLRNELESLQYEKAERAKDYADAAVQREEEIERVEGNVKQLQFEAHGLKNTIAGLMVTKSAHEVQIADLTAKFIALEATARSVVFSRREYGQGTQLDHAIDDLAHVLVRAGGPPPTNPDGGGGVPEETQKALGVDRLLCRSVPARAVKEGDVILSAPVYGEVVLLGNLWAGQMTFVVKNGRQVKYPVDAPLRIQPRAGGPLDRRSGFTARFEDVAKAGSPERKIDLSSPPGTFNEAAAKVNLSQQNRDMPFPAFVEWRLQVVAAWLGTTPEKLRAWCEANKVGDFVISVSGGEITAEDVDEFLRLFRESTATATGEWRVPVVDPNVPEAPAFDDPSPGKPDSEADALDEATAPKVGSFDDIVPDAFKGQGDDPAFPMNTPPHESWRDEPPGQVPYDETGRSSEGVVSTPLEPFVISKPPHPFAERVDAEILAAYEANVHDTRSLAGGELYVARLDPLSDDEVRDFRIGWEQALKEPSGPITVVGDYEIVVPLVATPEELAATEGRTLTQAERTAAWAERFAASAARLRSNPPPGVAPELVQVSIDAAESQAASLRAELLTGPPVARQNETPRPYEPGPRVERVASLTDAPAAPVELETEGAVDEPPVTTKRGAALAEGDVVWYAAAWRKLDGVRKHSPEGTYVFVSTEGYSVGLMRDGVYQVQIPNPPTDGDATDV